MTSRAKFLLVGAGLVVLGLVVMFFVDSRGPEPELVCVSESADSSGFADEDQGNCPVSIDSYDEWSEWNSSPRWSAVGAVALVLAGVVVGVIGLFRRPRADEESGAGGTQ